MYYISIDLLKHYIPSIIYMIVASALWVVVYELLRAWVIKKVKK